MSYEPDEQDELIADAMALDDVPADGDVRWALVPAGVRSAVGSWFRTHRSGYGWDRDGPLGLGAEGCLGSALSGTSGRRLAGRRVWEDPSCTEERTRGDQHAQHRVQEHGQA
jgi:hypothetical protein